MERRFTSAESIKKGTISGYAVKWNTPVFVDEIGRLESFKPGSLKIPPEGCPLFFQHRDDRPLANSKAQTIRFKDDGKGLFFEADLPKSAVFERESIERGDIGGASVGFFATAEDYSNGDRVIQDAILEELSLVCSPAHTGTEVQLRKTRKGPKKNKWTKLLWAYSGA